MALFSLSRSGRKPGYGNIFESEIWRSYSAGIVTDEEFRSYVRELYDMNGNAPDDKLDRALSDVFTPIEEVVRILRKAREEGVTLTALTNVEPCRLRFLRDIGILGLFDYVAASCELKVMKPDQRIYEEALKTSGCQDPADAMFVDGLEANVLAAAELGIAAHKYETPEGFSNFLLRHGHYIPVVS